jgi:hypothetical protein
MSILERSDQFRSTLNSGMIFATREFLHVEEKEPHEYSNSEIEIRMNQYVEAVRESDDSDYLHNRFASVWCWIRLRHVLNTDTTEAGKQSILRVAMQARHIDILDTAYLPVELNII